MEETECSGLKNKKGAFKPLSRPRPKASLYDSRRLYQCFCTLSDGIINTEKHRMLPSKLFQANGLFRGHQWVFRQKETHKKKRKTTFCTHWNVWGRRGLW